MTSKEARAKYNTQDKRIKLRLDVLYAMTAHGMTSTAAYDLIIKANLQRLHEMKMKYRDGNVGKDEHEVPAKK